MTESVTGQIYIINSQAGVEGSGTRVTEAEYNAWLQNNAVTAIGTDGAPVDIVGGNDKISVVDGTTTQGYDNIQQPGDGAGSTSYSTAAQAAAVALTPQEAQAAFDLQLIRIQEVNQEVQGDPIIRQVLSNVQGTFGTEAELRTAAAAQVAEYFGITNPLGLSAIERALKTITAQVPGISEIRTVASVAGQGVKITDIVNQNNINLQDVYNVARAIALTVNPGLRVPLAVAEGLVGLTTGTTQAAIASVTDSFTTLTAATGGGGGAEGEDPPPGDIVTAASTVTSQADFVQTPTGLLVTPEDLFTETPGGLNVLTEEIGNQVENTLPEPVDETNTGTGYYPNGLPYDDNGNLNPGWAINPETGEPYFKGYDYVDPTTAASAAASRQAATLASARSQAAQQAQRKQANDGDWRVKLRLAPGAEYLYKDPGLNSNGILWPLNVSDGVVFPYMPVINTSYHANYSSYDLTHSNYRGYFYQNSYVGEVGITATFTAQDTKEAEYMLAVIHFFRSATKMFYGQDAPGRGSPPPLVYLQGLGEYQFNLHPCLISQFTYNLPNDVDYIRARSPNLVGTNLQIKRDRETNPTNPFSAAIKRLNSIGQPKGGINIPPAPPTLGTNSPTYVPTKIEIQLTLLPTQTRQQVSQEFSLQKFANGNLLKGGFW